ncbi:MAG: GMC family oxidoreductase N-terminal domain-containing protein [Rubrivivax sp.]|nr:GMC family oxidoreductase N-terminal domain-containing protein [Rubrivivax sp.]
MPASADPALTFDHIVIGAGTAGCLLANRLSADRKRHVLLIEAGGRDNYHWIHIPVGYLYCIGNPRTDWLYFTEPDAGLNGRRLRYPRGKVLGGCSSINGMIYMRGQSRDYDGWALACGDDSWRWEACLPYFKAHEDHWRGASAAHGAPGFDPSGARSGGEWRVEKQRLHWDILDAWAEAAVQAGIERTDDFNTGNNAGVGYFEVNQRRGWRWNTTKAFLQPALARGNNLQVWTDSPVVRLVFERGARGLRCTGAQVRTPQGVVTVRARHEVLLCSGAIGTPALLQRSGIGPATLLQQHGITVQHELPGVGENLQDHLQVRAVYQVQGTRTLNTRANSLWGKAMIAAEYALSRSGPMSMAPSQLGAFVRSSPGREWPNLEYHVQPLSLDAFGEPLHRFDAITTSVCNLNPTSRGHVRITSPEPDAAPCIAPMYLSTDEDRRIAAESLRLTRHIAAQPALARYRPQEYKPGVQFQSDEELARLAGDIATTIFHPVGTCRMGRAGEPDAVVDSRLRVQGVAGLRIADGSIMPSITSGNTNSPILMLAERAAEWVQQDLQAG